MSLKHFKHTIEGQIHKLETRDPRQPYINLINIETATAKALSRHNIEEYQRLEVKSVYFKVKKLEFSEELAEQIELATQFDIREILIFAHADSALTSELFKEFLKLHKISINLQIVTYTDDDLEKIRKQDRGEKDLLAFENLLEYKLFYLDGVSLPMLNNPETDRLIEENYQAKRDLKIKSFEYQPPKYVTESKDTPASEQDDEVPAYEVTFQMQVQASVAAHTDVSIDQAQLRDSIPIDETKINEQAEERKKVLFSESSIQACTDTKGHLHFDGIEKISRRALKFILDHQDVYDDFIAGYLPPGFDLDKKSGTLFLFDQQNNQGQANDLHFTKRIGHRIVSPIQYSWLEHARFGTRTLKAIQDKLVDIPNALCHSGFDRKYHKDLRTSTTKPLQGIFPGLKFMSSLSEAGEQNLRGIWTRLEARGIHEIVTKILAGNRQNHKEVTQQYVENFLTELFINTYHVDIVKHAKKLKLSGFQKIFRHIPSDYKLADHSLESISAMVSEACDRYEAGVEKKSVEEEIGNIFRKHFKEGKFNEAIRKILIDSKKFHKEDSALLEKKMQTFFETLFNVCIVKDSKALRSKVFDEITKHTSYRLENNLESQTFYETVSGICDQYEADLEKVKNKIKEIFLKHFKASKVNELISKILTDGRKPHDENSFLLEDEMRAFFAKLFTKILPSSDSNDSKLKFFHEIFSHLPANYNFGAHSLNDVFEGLSGAYDQFKELLLKDGIKEGSVRFEALFSKWRERLPKRFESEHNNWRTIFISELNLFNLISDNGGSIEELFEYLNPEVNLAEILPMVQKYSLGAVHSFIKTTLHFEESWGVSWGQEWCNLGAVHAPFKIKDLDDARQAIIPRPKLSTTVYAPYDFYQAILFLAKTSQRACMDSWQKVYAGKWHSFCNPNVNASVYVLSDRASEMKSAHGYRDWQWGEGYHMPSNLDKQAARKIVAQREKEAYAAYEQEIAKYNDTKCFCAPAIWIQTEDHNLSEGFTRPYLNLPLLSLAIIRSSGTYYDPKYPLGDTQEFVGIVSTLFEPFRIKTSIECSVKASYFEYDYNSNSARSRESYPRPSWRGFAMAMLEGQHESAVANLLNIAKESSLSFTEAMCVWLVAFLYPNKEARTIDYVKSLKAQYGKTLYHAMRTVFLASSGNEDEGILWSVYYKILGNSNRIPADGKLSVEALKLRASNLFDYLEFLHKSANDQSLVHKVLTKNGLRPENLVLFAGYYSHLRYKDLSTDVVKDFQDKVSNVKEAEEFYSLLQRLPLLITKENAFLKPLFKEGKIDFEYLGPIASDYGTKVKFQSRFNPSGEEMANGANVPDFLELEGRYNIKLEFHGQKYYKIRDDLISNPGYLAKSIQFPPSTNFFGGWNIFQALTGFFGLTIQSEQNTVAGQQDSKISIEFVKEFTSALLAVFTREDNDLFHKDFIDIAFDPKTPIGEQLNMLESSKEAFEKILASCSTDYRQELVQTLKKAAIPPQAVKNVFVYLQSLEMRDLLEVVKLAPSRIYQNPAFLKVVTNFGLKNKIPLMKLYAAFEPLALVPDIEVFAKKMLEHCEKESSYKPLDAFKAIDTQDQLAIGKYEWVTLLDLQEIESLISTFNPTELAQIFRLNDLEKLSVFTDIALHFEKNLLPEQYQKLLSFFHGHYVGEAKLVRSYLKTAGVEQVLKHLNSLEMLQESLANPDDKRFQYDEALVIAKLKTVQDIITGEPFSDKEQAQLLEDFEQAMKYAKKYRNYNYNQLRAKALSLKYHKSMAEHDDPQSTHEHLDLAFLGLIAEVLYRETGKFPYYHQILAVLIKMAPPGSLIEEAATSEGKSIISALLAAYSWYTGQKVDMLTSNQILASDGLKEFGPFYEALGIKYASKILTPDFELEDYMAVDIVHSTPSDIALFLSRVLFYKTQQEREEILARIKKFLAIIDEGDDLLKSFVTFKLGVALFSMSLNTFLGFVVEFSKTDWNKVNISLEDRAANLRKFLVDKIQKEGAPFPLSVSDEKKLKAENSQLYLLNKALLEVSSNEILMQLLKSLLVAEKLMANCDSEFIVERKQVNGQEQCKITAVINSIPQPEVLYGNLVHQLLEVLLKNKGICQHFIESIPTGTAAIKSAKNLVDLYDSAFILTATPGDLPDLDEFCKVNKICQVFKLPRYYPENRTIHEHQTVHFDTIVQRALEIAAQDERPLFVYLSDIGEAKKFYKAFISDPQFAKLSRNPMLCVGADDDPKECKDIKIVAGQSGAITFTTLLYGRGMHVEIKNGAVLINACTKCTLPEDWQIIGRIGRMGTDGEVWQFCDQDTIGDQKCDAFKKAISESRRAIRLHDQPLTDILNYPGWVFTEQEAVEFDKAVNQIWKKTLSGRKVTVENSKNLRAKLVDAMSDMPKCSGKIDGLKQYLEQIDKTPSPQPNEVFPEHPETRTADVAKIMDQSPAGLVEKISNILINFYTKEEKIAQMFIHFFSWTKTEFCKDGKCIQGEGSYGNQMLEKFKEYFANFHMLHNNAELDGVRVIVNKFVDITDLNVNEIQPDQWYPIALHTKVTTSAGHAETMMFHFDKGLLFWVNSEDGGIKIYKIKESLDKVKAAFGELVTPESQVYTRKKIWSLLEYNEENPSFDQEPPHLTVPMERQVVGNCGWAQTIGIIKAIVVMLNFDLDEAFLGKTKAEESLEFKKAVNHADAYDHSFKTYSKAAFLEEVVCLTSEKLCKPQLLPLTYIKEQIKVGYKALTQPLLVELSQASKELCKETKGTIYESSACTSAESLPILAVAVAEMGQMLQKITGNALAVLEQCSMRGRLEELEQHYRQIFTDQRITDKESAFAHAAELTCQQDVEHSCAKLVGVEQVPCKASA